MKRLIICAIVIALSLTQSSASNFMLLHVGQADGSNGGGGGAVVACPQTGLDFSNPCNLIYQPALIH